MAFGVCAAGLLLWIELLKAKELYQCEMNCETNFGSKLQRLGYDILTFFYISPKNEEYVTLNH